MDGNAGGIVRFEPGYVGAETGATALEARVGTRLVGSLRSLPDGSSWSWDYGGIAGDARRGTAGSEGEARAALQSAVMEDMLALVPSVAPLLDPGFLDGLKACRDRLGLRSDVASRDACDVLDTVLHVRT